jgi:hypothetical protein
VRRTVQPIKGNVASEPPTFDIEHLRQTYDANWGIEADAVDVSLSDQSSSILAAPGGRPANKPGSGFHNSTTSKGKQIMPTQTIVSHPIQVVERFLGQQNVERLKAVGVTLITAAITVACGLILIAPENAATVEGTAGQMIWDQPRQPNPILSLTGIQPAVEAAADVNPVDPSSAILAASPELAIARRYAAMVEWRRLHHPGR